MEAALADLLTHAATTTAEHESDDRTSERILDAAVLEAAAVGLQRLTVEDVVRRAGIARMTVYRRFPRRDDLVQALILRESQRFLGTVAAAIDSAGDPSDEVAVAFVAAVRFARKHPMLRRVAQAEPGAFMESVAADDAALLGMGRAFIARHIHGDGPGAPSRQAQWAADALARLFLTYVAIPPTNPAPESDDELRRFAHEVLTPMVELAAA